jgi:hypothetical protein
MSNFNVDKATLYRLDSVISEYFDKYLLFVSFKGADSSDYMIPKNMDFMESLECLDSGLDKVTDYLDDVETGKKSDLFAPQVLSDNLIHAELNHKLLELLKDCVHGYVLIAPACNDPDACFNHGPAIMFPTITNGLHMIVTALSKLQKVESRRNLNETEEGIL